MAPQNRDRLVSVNAMVSELRTYMASWRTSAFAKQLRALLLSRSEKWAIDRAVVIGLGCTIPRQLNEETDEEYCLFRRHILCQCMMFQEIANIFSSEQGDRSIEMFASDPDIDRLDEELLERLGITVVDKWEELVTTKTFVYSPFAPWPVGLRAIRRSPELYLGVDWTVVIELHDPRDPSKRKEGRWGMTMEQYAVCETFLKGRVESIFPGLENFPEYAAMDWERMLESHAELIGVTYTALLGPFRLYWPKPALPPVEGEGKRFG
ncbi:uncharacterized protein BDZ99DRAFT_514647 [Mytilinidion resinicola]|uniref:SRR1-like domain-containing protein n=1 Tax=Mytilinidion resinicola TaxID=574789 RepID=A0A6A6Z4G2_9PEZI|nr:uncharacterized protein BDZ99DRAFT_514647 [Mytilinidion resinicola]KAF2816032.1 hypothetical protein BDZ99DRAFT_514647 [Mytilinidion resinicola]